MKISKEITLTLLLVWPLLFGMFMVMVGNGLQGTLLSLRANFEGFPISIIGIVMSLYYCGYLAGWYMVPRMINAVGHIRVFAGFASMASTTILIQGMFVDPYTWGIVRILSGISFVGLFIVSESWLNDISTNKLRARIFSAYIFVIHGGLFCGQFLINLAPVEALSLFVLISIIISMSLIPVTLASKATPHYDEPENLPFMQLIKKSSLSVVCVLTSGFCGAAILSIGPVYGDLLGYKISKIALFVAAFILGCGLLPLLTGWIADNFDRRRVLIGLAIIALTASLLAPLNGFLLLPATFLLGGCVTSIYTVATAMMNDRLKPKQRTSATASLILLNGIASCISPILIGTLMQFWGPGAFFITFSAIFGILCVYGLWRAYIGPEIDIEAQEDFQNLPTRGGSGAAVLAQDQ